VAAIKDLTTVKYTPKILRWLSRYSWFITHADQMPEKWQKLRCRDITTTAISLGILVRPKFCTRCGEECRCNAHHESYTEPLKVKWYCRKCHNKKDREREERLGITRRINHHKPYPISLHREIRKKWATGKYNQVQLGKMFNVSRATINATVRNLVFAE
jgi:hypothetical protein